MKSLLNYAVFGGILLAAGGAATPRAPEPIIANDNRQAAGTLKNGVLTVKLEAREGLWRPDGDQGRALPVAAWAEEGKPLSVPGPLIRVPSGTEVRASLRNSLDKPLTVFGFGKTRGVSDSIVIPSGASRVVRFTASATGTYYYLARRGVNSDFFNVRLAPDLELAGAIVIDSAGAPAPKDRVFVMSFWFAVDPTSPTGIGRSTMAINGLSWPHTERIDLTQGDSVHWRVINLTELDHPMHLHGFYFRVERKGNGVRDTLYTKEQQRLAVTEVALPFSTMSLSWLPDRAGNWIYHCHYPDHISMINTIDTDRGHLDDGLTAHHPSDRPHEMFGLVLGLRVAANGPPVQLAEAARKVRMIMRQRERVFGAQPGYSMVLAGTAAEKDSNALQIPGPTLVLERGKPVAITVVNHAKEQASIHWHGIELESYPDGVPGWSGSGNHVLPSIAPGDSLTVRWTPPRAGTFMYHSHFNESAQISGGLYGPIIVMEPGQTYDPEHDRVLFFGITGPTKNVIFGPFSHNTMNGEEQPAGMELRAGTTYRFRLLNLADGSPTAVSLRNGTTPVMWKAVAKDGAALPPWQATSRPATLVFDPGEIYDFELTPGKPQELQLSFGPFLPPPPPGVTLPPNLPAPAPQRTVAVHVR